MGTSLPTTTPKHQPGNSNHKTRSEQLAARRLSGFEATGSRGKRRSAGSDRGDADRNGSGEYEQEYEEDSGWQLSDEDDRSWRSSSSSREDDEVLEMDLLSPDARPEHDEESVLSTHERRKRWHMRRRQRRDLDSRTIDLQITNTGRRLADRTVLRKLVINIMFILMWYLFSLSISIYNKWMFSPEHLNFPYPLFTTSLHMVVQFILSSMILYFLPSLRPSNQPPPQFPNAPPRPSSKPLMTKAFYLTRLVPCGSATSLDIGLGNMSLRFITLSFLTMCKSSALAFVLLFAFLFRLENPSFKLILIICSMIVGVVMMVAGEPDFSALGFALVIASAFFSGFRWGLTQILLLRHPATSNPFSTLFLLTPIMFVSLTVISLVIEGPFEILAGIKQLAADNGAIKGILLLSFPGSLAFCMIASEFALLKRSSVVTLSICGIFKEVITIIAGGSVFDDKLTPVNIGGLVITIVSIAYYNYMKITKMRKDARKDVAITNTDVNDGTDDETDSQPATEGPSTGLFERLGVSLGRSSANNEGGRYQAVHSPNSSPLDSQFGATADGPSTTPSVRARMNGPGSSPLANSQVNSNNGPSANASDNQSDAETGGGRLSRKDRALRNTSRSGILASDFSDVHTAESTGVRERSLSRKREPASPPSRN